MALAVALVLGVVGAGCSGGDGTTAETAGPLPPVVEVVTVQPAPLRETADLVGELRADESVVVKSEIDGIVESIGFSEGQAAVAGEVLFRLRDGEQAARLREAEARKVLAADEHRRTQRLAKQNATAAARLEQTAAELEVEHARVELARVEFERTRIRAPFDGMVGARLVSPGERITSDTELVRVDATDPLQVLFSIPEWGAPYARLGAPLSMRVAAYPDERFQGEVFFIEPSVNRQTRRLVLKGRIPNSEGRLRPGMFAQVHVEIAAREALLVPDEAVVHDRTGTFVWRVDAQGIAERVPVETGTHQRGRVEIRSGLHSGDRVVFAGTHKILGAKTRVEAVAAPERRVEEDRHLATEPRSGGDG
jgi:membrane fusion protein (multidrug efflux system)